MVLSRLVIKPVVLGKRIELIHTDNPYADLKPGDRGTAVDVSNCLMKKSLPRSGFCGIVTQDLQSWIDTTITGWFTTMTMKGACYRLTCSECGKPFGTIVCGNLRGARRAVALLRTISVSLGCAACSDRLNSVW
jgi:hypothetical protein